MGAQSEIIEWRRPSHKLGNYCAWRLPEESASLADMVWTCARNETQMRHRVLPLGEPSLAIRRRWSRFGALESAELIMCGPHAAPFWNLTPPDEELIAVRVKPEIAAGALGLAPADFAGLRQTPLEQGNARQFRRTLSALEKSSSGVIAALLNDIQDLAATTDCTARPEVRAGSRLRQTHGAVTIRTIADELSVSERHLRRRFKDATGFSPKDYARRLRVAHVAVLADDCAHPHWAALAADAGYHDQSHMIAEFQALVGMTPTALHAERRAEAG